ncbi:MAG TPA: hypothetical protein P5136_00025 [Methanofastidiosum sp.]|nr:hypothetical protein [Methanofastidiosum sp.]
MQLFNNDIRMKCEEILANIQELSRRNTSRESAYFLNEVKDKIIEIMYTSDEWHSTINIDHDKIQRLIQRSQDLETVLGDVDDDIDDMEPGRTKKQQ